VPRLIFHPEADGEYFKAFQWYKARSPQAASRFEAEVEAVLARIVADPESFPHYDAIHRFAIVQRFPYSIVYQTISEQLMSLRWHIRVARQDTGKAASKPSAKHLPQLAQVVERLFQLGSFNPGLAASSVAFAE
jgi:plasmid stabilization system protein ParE